ncbi:hypothetical protein BS47DRAFT_1378932 [Hydnum rufescens UP504]|uniref:Uncharacterized protein n=1 Tax=Hydnum rufescens UP504 TaxID=1448309 RepID=A0A9P6B9V1_9AGAM|nr:hypothetical protein BS47DRAFT_1378932 [Hydnum rufescens UP504]
MLLARLGRMGTYSHWHSKTARALKAALKPRKRAATRFAEQGFAFIYSIFITRQIRFPRIVQAVTFDMPVYLPLDWNQAVDHFITRNGWMFFTVSLWTVWVQLCMWFYMACRLLSDIFRGNAVAVEDWRGGVQGHSVTRDKCVLEFPLISYGDYGPWLGPLLLRFQILRSRESGWMDHLENDIMPGDRLPGAIQGHLPSRRDLLWSWQKYHGSKQCVPLYVRDISPMPHACSDCASPGQDP